MPFVVATRAIASDVELLRVNASTPTVFAKICVVTFTYRFFERGVQRHASSGHHSRSHSVKRAFNGQILLLSDNGCAMGIWTIRFKDGFADAGRGRAQKQHPS